MQYCAVSISTSYRRLAGPQASSSAGSSGPGRGRRKALWSSETAVSTVEPRYNAAECSPQFVALHRGSGCIYQPTGSIAAAGVTLHLSTAPQNPNLATIIWYIHVNGRNVISEYSRMPKTDLFICVHDCVPAFPITTIVALMSYILTRLLYNSPMPIPVVISLSSCHTVADTGYLTP